MNLTPETKKFIDGLKGAPLYELSPIDAREFLENLQKTEIKTNIENVVLNSGLNVCIVRPDGARGKLPAILYIHGGGWVLGSVNSWANLLKEISENSGCAVIFPEYSLSPEAKFPIALNEIYTVYENLEKFNVNTEKVIIMGDSAGGNMAAVTALRAAKEKKPFALQIIFYPAADASMKTGSYEEFKDGPWLTKKAMEWFFDAYEPNKSLRKDPRISPILADENELALLPETLVITAENDVLRDEGENYAAKLARAGVSVSCARINGVCHDFMVLNALDNTPAKQTALLLSCAKIKKVVEK